MSRVAETKGRVSADRLHTSSPLLIREQRQTARTQPDAQTMSAPLTLILGANASRLAQNLSPSLSNMLDPQSTSDVRNGQSETYARYVITASSPTAKRLSQPQHESLCPTQQSTASPLRRHRSVTAAASSTACRHRLSGSDDRQRAGSWPQRRRRRRRRRRAIRKSMASPGPPGAAGGAVHRTGRRDGTLGREREELEGP